MERRSLLGAVEVCAPVAGSTQQDGDLQRLEVWGAPEGKSEVNLSLPARAKTPEDCRHLPSEALRVVSEDRSRHADGPEVLARPTGILNACMRPSKRKDASVTRDLISAAAQQNGAKNT